MKALSCTQKPSSSKSSTPVLKPATKILDELKLEGEISSKRREAHGERVVSFLKNLTLSAFHWQDDLFACGSSGSIFANSSHLLFGKLDQDSLSLGC